MSNETVQEEITAGAIRQTQDENYNYTERLKRLKSLRRSAEKSRLEWMQAKELAEALNHSIGDGDAAIQNANNQLSWLAGFIKGLEESMS